MFQEKFKAFLEESFKELFKQAWKILEAVWRKLQVCFFVFEAGLEEVIEDILNLDSIDLQVGFKKELKKSWRNIWRSLELGLKLV